MDNLVGCAAICGTKKTRIRLAEQTYIFNAEAQAIKATRRWRITEKVILTDSLGNLIAQESLQQGQQQDNKTARSTGRRDLSLRLMWVPAHTGITGNEPADEAAKEALDQNLEMRIKVVKSDYTKWVKEKCKEK
jgi:ribonuclease HI